MPSTWISEGHSCGPERQEQPARLQKRKLIVSVMQNAHQHTWGWHHGQRALSFSTILNSEPLDALCVLWLANLSRLPLPPGRSDGVPLRFDRASSIVEGGWTRRHRVSGLQSHDEK